MAYFVRFILHRIHGPTDTFGVGDDGETTFQSQVNSSPIDSLNYMHCLVGLKIISQLFIYIVVGDNTDQVLKSVCYALYWNLRHTPEDKMSDIRKWIRCANWSLGEFTECHVTVEWNWFIKENNIMFGKLKIMKFDADNRGTSFYFSFHFWWNWLICLNGYGGCERNAIW